MLAQRVAELLSPARGLRVLAIDRLDPPATLAVAAHCVSCACAGAGCASPICATGDVQAGAARTAGFVRAVVGQALSGAFVCPTHECRLWPESGAGCLRELAGDAVCTTLKVRADSWTVSVGRGTKSQMTPASTLCVHCAQRVYGVQKTKKLAQIACFKCRGPVEALLYSELAGPLIADRLAVSSPPFLACPEPLLSTDAGPVCIAPARAPDGIQVDCYDKPSPGHDACTGAVLRLSQGGREMHDGCTVITPRSAVTIGLTASSIGAARSAKRRRALPWTS